MRDDSFRCHPAFFASLRLCVFGIFASLRFLHSCISCIFVIFIPLQTDPIRLIFRRDDNPDGDQSARKRLFTHPLLSSRSE